MKLQSKFLQWLLIALLACPQGLVSDPIEGTADAIAPTSSGEVFSYEATAETGESIQVGFVEATNDEELEAAKDWVEKTLNEGGAKDADVTLHLLTTSPEAEEETLPLESVDLIGQELTQVLPVDRVEFAKLPGPRALLGLPAPDETPPHENLQKWGRRSANVVFCIFRTYGIGLGVTYMVQVANNVPTPVAAAIGWYRCARMSLGLQIGNTPFQYWLTSPKFFGLAKETHGPDGKPFEVASHSMTFAKLVLTTTIYMGVVTHGMYVGGMSHAEGLFEASLAAANFVYIVFSGTFQEYVFDRYISESMRTAIAKNPRGKYWYLTVADGQAALISVVGTVTAAAAVNTILGKVAALGLVGVGIKMYVRKFGTPEPILRGIERTTSILSKTSSLVSNRAKCCLDWLLGRQPVQ